MSAGQSLFQFFADLGDAIVFGKRRQFARARGTSVFAFFADLGESIVFSGHMEQRPEKSPTLFNWFADYGETILRLGHRALISLADIPGSVARYLLAPSPERDAHFAMITSSPGTMLSGRGTVIEATQHLEKSVAIARDVVERHEKELSPWRRANLLHNLGAEMRWLGGRIYSSTVLAQSAELYRSALRGYAEARAGAQEAQTQYELGTALQTLSESIGDVELLLQAIAAYRSALSWREGNAAASALAELRLPSALRRLGERTNSVDPLRRAVDAYRAVLHDYPELETRPRTEALLGLGTAFTSLSSLTGDSEMLEVALAVYSDALDVSQRGDKLLAATARINMANIYRSLGQKTQGMGLLQQAVTDLFASEEYQESDPLELAAIRFGLGTELAELDQNIDTAPLLGTLNDVLSRRRDESAVIEKRLAPTLEAVRDLLSR